MAKGNPKSNFPNAQQPALKPEEMGGMVAAMEELRELPKINTNDPDELESRVRYFFEWCTEKQLRPGVELLALCIGTSRQNLASCSCVKSFAHIRSIIFALFAFIVIPP